MYKNNKKTFREVVRFMLVGVAGLAANISLLVAFVEVFTISQKAAAILSTILTLFLTFFMTDEWVFENMRGNDNKKLRLKRGGSYYVVMLLGKLFNYGIYLLLISVSVWYPIAWSAGSLIVFIGTFTLNRTIWYNVW